MDPNLGYRTIPAVSTNIAARALLCVVTVQDVSLPFGLFRNVEAHRPLVQWGDRLRPGQRGLDRFEQRLDTEVDEGAKDLIVMRRQENARLEQFDQVLEC